MIEGNREHATGRIIRLVRVDHTLHKLADLIRLAAPCQIDAEVLLGYIPDREVSDSRLVIGPEARVRSGTVIYAGTRIGSGLQTGHHVVIREQNEIGDHLSIWNNSTIDYGCCIGNRVKIHTNVYVAQFTILEDDVFLAPGVTIANDLHPGAAYSRELLRGPTLKRGAQIGCNVTLLPSVIIGEAAIVGAGSVVVRDVPPHAVVAGNPARVIKMIDDLRSPEPAQRPYRRFFDVSFEDASDD